MQSQQYLIIIPQDGLCCKFTRCSKSISTIAETHLKGPFAKNASKPDFSRFSWKMSLQIRSWFYIMKPTIW